MGRHDDHARVDVFGFTHDLFESTSDPYANALTTVRNEYERVHPRDANTSEVWISVRPENSRPLAPGADLPEHPVPALLGLII
jgi:hypothetical protein